MIKIKIVCVGKIKDAYLDSGIKEYLKRLTSYAKVEIIEVKDEKIDNHASLSALREQRKIERAKTSALRFKEKARIKEQKLLNAREEKKRAHQLRTQELRSRREERERRAKERYRIYKSKLRRRVRAVKTKRLPF